MYPPHLLQALSPAGDRNGTTLHLEMKWKPVSVKRTEDITPPDSKTDGMGRPFPLSGGSQGALDSPRWASLGAAPLAGGGGESALVQVPPFHSGALIRAHIFSEAPRTIPNVASTHQCLPVDLLLPRGREVGGCLQNQPVNSALL